MKKIIILFSILILSGCASVTKTDPKPDPKPVSIEPGHIFSKSIIKKGGKWHYQVMLDKGELVNIESEYPEFTLNDCVEVFHYESTPPNIAYGSDCKDRRIQLDTVHILSRQVIPEQLSVDERAIEADERAKANTKLVRKRVGEGVAAGFVAPLEDPLTIVLYPIVAPITVTIGAVAGLVFGNIEGALANKPPKPINEEALQKRQSIIKELPESINFQRNLALQIYNESENLKKPEFFLYNSDESIPHEKVTYLDNTKKDSKQAFLVVTINHLGFVGGSGADPEMSFYIICEARLATTSNENENFVSRFFYESDRIKLSQWSSDDLKTLKGEITKANQQFASMIINEYFYNAPDNNIEKKKTDI